MTQQERFTERGSFVQYPCNLIYHCPDLTRDDKWVLLSIMGVCWTEDFYKLSYREIANLSGVPISLLSSIAEKNGRPAKEGIMDRLKRLGYIRCKMGKAMNRSTGKPKGNAQTYISVDYKKIWGENVNYKISPYAAEDYQPVRIENEPVSYTNRLNDENGKPVSYTNAPVLNTNSPVSYTNEPVRTARSNSPLYITVDNSDTLDKDTSVVANATDTTLTIVFDVDDIPDFSHVAELPVVSQWLKQTPSQKALVSHPEHSFLWFDDLMAPSLMVVKMTPAFPHPHYSEMEDKRRERIACWEVKPYLESKGLKLTIKWEHESEDEIVDTRPYDSRGNDTPPLSGVGDSSAEVDKSTELNPVTVRTTEARDVVTPSLPYDETPTPEIGLERDYGGADNARNPGGDETSNQPSYSPGDSTKSETPAPEGEPPKTTRRRGTRKPRAKKPEPFVVPEELRERVDKVYAFLDKLRQEVTNDPEERFIHDMDSDKAICELFEGKPPTETRMKKVFLGMWNEARNPRTGYLPRDHMTIPAICKQYKSKAMSLAADENTKALVNTISNQQQYQVVTEDDDMAFTRPSERNRRMRQGA